MTYNMQHDIRTWYHDEFPTDECWEDILEGMTFLDLFDALDHYRDVYGVIGVRDSLIRERCFQKLSELMDCEYDYIYSQWLMSAE